MECYPVFLLARMAQDRKISYKQKSIIQVMMSLTLFRVRESLGGEHMRRSRDGKQAVTVCMTRSRSLLDALGQQFRTSECTNEYSVLWSRSVPIR